MRKAILGAGLASLTLTAAAVAPGIAPAFNTGAKLEVGSDPLTGAPYFTYKDASADANRITVTQVGDVFTITDPGASSIDITGAVPFCTLNLLQTAVCTVPAGYPLKVDTGPGDDTVTANISRGAKLVGGAGDDVLQGGTGADRLEGDAGTDTVTYAGRLTSVLASADNVADDGAPGEGDDVRSDVEHLIGTTFGDRLTASRTMPGTLTGGAGDDTLITRNAVADTLECGDGADAYDPDALDTVGTDCETYTQTTTTSTGGAGTSGDDPGEDTGDDTGDRPGTGAGRGPAIVGRLLGAEPGKGKVKVKAPGGSAYKELRPGGAVPVGATVDASEGAVTLTAATGAAGETQHATFHGARFTVTQTTGAHPVTVLRLRGGDFSVCRRAAAANVARIASARRRVRSLWGSGHGRFRTRGRDSTASVRGTRWRMDDRCDGTFTRVTRGLVAVHDRRAHRTVLVPAGHSYLARR